MSTIRVWAPKPSSIELKIGDTRIPMSRSADGWWSLGSDSIRPGVDYSFILDGGEPVPDPRSPSQPFGVHGLSRIVDHGAFRWSDSKWKAPPLSSAVIYELHVGTFSKAGSFDGIIDHLPYLTELGITHVELMPVAEFSGDRGWGYDGVDLFAPHHSYGGPEALKRLVDACHGHGLAVILDVVYNHFGPSGNYLAQFGPYLTAKYHTPWGDAVNFDDAGSAEVRRFFCDNALMWFRDYHFDALRLDAIHAIVDTSAVHFLEQLAAEVRDLEAVIGRNLALIAESDLNDPRIVRAPEASGYGIDAQWSDDFHHALHAYLTGEHSGYYADFGGLGDIAKALTNAFVYDGRFSNYRGRRHGRPPLWLAGSKFLGYLQNHDQIGNRAKGERSSALMNRRKLKIAAAIVFASPFVPLIFQGEEWAAATPFQYFSGHPEPELGHAVSEGRKREFAAFGWDPADVPDPQSFETFRRSKLDWSELDREPHREMLEWHRALIRLRKQVAELSDGRLDRVRAGFDEKEQWLWFARGATTIACNFSNRPCRVPFLEECDRTVLLTSDSVALNRNAVELPAESVAIVRAANRSGILIFA